jgi:putative FmdB family regulatory protein
MPTYEYECPDCGCRFEKFESMTAKPAGRCPECGARGRRLISAGAGLIFKGPGFYATDYRSEAYKKDAAKEKSEAACSPAKCDTCEHKPSGNK